MNSLALLGLHAADHFTIRRAPARFGLRSPALALIGDERFVEPHVLDSGMHATDASRHLQHTQDAAALVLDRGGAVVGAIMREDLSEERIMRRVALGERRDDIRVADLMTPRHQIRALSVQALKEATVGDVLEALRNHGKRFCLVVEPQVHEIRGLIAASMVARRLGVVPDGGCGSTFADVFAAIHG